MNYFKKIIQQKKIVFSISFLLVALIGLPSYFMLALNNQVISDGEIKNTEIINNVKRIISKENYEYSLENSLSINQFGSNKESLKGPIEDDLYKLKINNSHDYFREMQRKKALESNITLSSSSKPEERKIISRSRISDKLIEKLQTR